MRKVASTSMQEILLPYCVRPPAGGLAHIKSRAWLEWNYRKYLPRAHESILTVKRRMPVERFQRYFKFAFVRNPWDRLVSEYEFILKRPQHGRHARVAGLDGFHDFIRMQIPRRDAYQVNTVCDRRGNLLVDFVGKMERLDEDWTSVCERIGIPHQSLPYRKVGGHKPYRDYYDEETQRLVENHWACDIAMFEYSF